MLRITIDELPRSTTFRLEGKLQGPWVDELNRAWRALPLSQKTECVLVDLRSVSSVDARAKELLAQMYQGGVELLADKPMTKYVVEQVMHNPNWESKKEG